MGDITLLNCDCMTYMKTCKDNEFDLAIVDPNYGIGASRPSNKSKMVTQKNGNKLYQKDGGYKHKDWDDKPADDEYFDELLRVSKHQIIWGVNFYGRVFGKGRIVWDKLNDHSDQHDCEIAYCSMNERVDIVRYMWAGFMQGLNIGKDVVTANRQIGNKKLNEKRIHPTQKPVKLYYWLLSCYAEKGQKILDTHAGSMSSVIACYDFGCDIVACEKDKDYFTDAKDRVKAETAQEALF